MYFAALVLLAASAAVEVSYMAVGVPNPWWGVGLGGLGLVLASRQAEMPARLRD